MAIFSYKAGAQKLSFEWEVRVRSGKSVESEEDLKYPVMTETEQKGSVGQWRWKKENLHVVVRNAGLEKRHTWIQVAMSPCSDTMCVTWGRYVMSLMLSVFMQ